MTDDACLQECPCTRDPSVSGGDRAPDAGGDCGPGADDDGCACSPGAPGPTIQPGGVPRSRRALRTGLATALLALGLAVRAIDVPAVAGGVPWPPGAGDLALVGATVAGAAGIVRRGAAASLDLEFDVYVLESLAIVAATALGMFVEAAVLAVLIAVAHLLEEHALARTRRSVRDLMELAPATATVRRGGQRREVPAAAVEPGDVVLVGPGERVPVDGLVTAGTGAVDQSAVTGESLPVEKSPGEEVFAGTVNGAAALEVEATAVAGETTLDRVVELVRAARENRPAFQRYVDRLASYYTPAVAAAAVAVAVAPPLALGAPWRGWLVRGLTLLVIACPCAFVISTPVTVTAAVTGAARRGMLVKGGDRLEALEEVEVVAFDKTGTLTAGERRVSTLDPADGAGERRLLRVAAALEARSEHPIADAVGACADERSVSVPDAANVRAVPGAGVRGRVEGRPAWAGKPELFADDPPRADGGAGRDGERTGREERRDRPAAAPPVASPEMRERCASLSSAGQTPVVVAHGERVLGVLGIADRPREDLDGLVDALAERGVERTVLLTGDRAAAGEALADAAGIDEVRAELLPDEKRAAVRDLRRAHGRVAMVGEGVNDAPALAAASVGIALGAAGTDVAVEAADVALMDDDLSRLPALLDLSAAANRVLRANVWGSLLIDLGLALAASLGLVGPVLAVLLGDAGLTVGVTANALRLGRTER